MKKPAFPRASCQAIAKSSAVAFFSLALAFSQARAVVLTWDINSGTTGAQDGAGTWDTVTQNWYNGTANQTFGATDSAVFGSGGTGAAVTLSTVSANSVSFGTLTAGGYTLSGGGLTLNGDANYVPSNFIAGQSSANLGTVGLYVTSASRAVIINSPITTTSAQTWISNNTTNTVSLGGAITPAAALTFSGAGTFRLAGSGGGIGASGGGGVNITVRGGSTLFDGDSTVATNNGITDRINSSNALILGGNGGGTFTLVSPGSGNNTHAQTLASLTVAVGSNGLTPGTAATGTATLTFGGAAATNYVRNAGGSVNIAQPASTTTSAAFSAGVNTVTVGTGLTNVYIGMPVSGTGLAGATYVTSYNSATGALGLSQNTSAASSSSTLSYASSTDTVVFTNMPSGASVVNGVLVGALINGNDFATTIAGGALNVAPYTYQSAAASWGANQNIAASVNTGFSGTTPATLTINSLRNGAAQNGTIAIGTAAGNTLTISSGMISSTPNNTLTINGPGALLTGNGQDYLYNKTNSSSTDIIAARLGSSAALTKAGAGGLTLSNAANAVTDVYVNGGTLNLSATGTLAASTGITVNGSGSRLTLVATNALASPSASTGSQTTAIAQVPITLNGGTLARGGTTANPASLGSGTAVGAGMLTLTAASTLDFGASGTTGVGTLNFNGFSDPGNFVLTVTNYTHTTLGAGVDGTDDRLIFNQDMSSYLDNFLLGGVQPFQVALGNGEYELVTAVPEPSTWAAGVLCVGALGLVLRRRSAKAFASRSASV